MNIDIKPLSPQVLDDYLNFFDNITFSENPEWSKCYCYSFHFVGDNEAWNGNNNRTKVIDLIKKGKMKGYLAYHDNKPIGWCNTNQRVNYKRLMSLYDLGDKMNTKVGSIVCFLIHPEYRKKGVAQEILTKISKDYSDIGYQFIEAYPEKDEYSCEGNYKGPLELYKKLGFKVINELKTYYIVQKELKAS